MGERLELRHKIAVEFVPEAPFAFDATLHKPGHFPSSDNEWIPGIRWQTMLWKGQPLGLRLENRGTVDVPKLTVHIWSEHGLGKPFVEDLTREITYRYNLKADLTEFNHAFENDTLLGPIIARWRGMRPTSYNSLYEYLIIAIVLQNATVRRSVNMMQALFERYGVPLSYDNKGFSCFWTPQAIESATEQDLRTLKIGYRAKSVKRVTEAFAEGRIDELRLRSESIDEQRSALMGLYGIGPASVGYILFDVFHHWDELAHISPWEQRIYSKLFFDVDPATPVPVPRLVEFFEKRFGKHKMLAVNYVWEDLFWKRKHEDIAWLNALIRL